MKGKFLNSNQVFNRFGLSRVSFLKMRNSGRYKLSKVNKRNSIFMSGSEIKDRQEIFEHNKFHKIQKRYKGNN